jgi:phage terminase small subunit
MAKLTPKQEAFCQAICDGMNQSDAYRLAYNAANMKADTINKKAYELMQNSNVKNRIDKINLAIMEVFILKKANELTEAIISEKAFDVINNDNKDKITKNKPRLNRYFILHRDGFKCKACGKKPSVDNDVVLHVDHIKPKSIGGTDEIDNLQTLCQECNISKSNKFAYDHNTGIDKWEN